MSTDKEDGGFKANVPMLEAYSKALMGHPDTSIASEEMGVRIPEYRPTYPFSGYIDAFHQSLAHCKIKGKYIDIHIDGWLRREDALKLYEMAYFCQGDILDVGTYHGLSAYIMAIAASNSSQGKFITSIDLSPDALAVAQKNLQELQIDLICGRVEEIITEMKAQQKIFAFTFVDHAHSYKSVYNLCMELDKIILSGGFIMIHDWNDARNGKDPGYEVYQAARNGLKDGQWRFYGCYGCSAIYRRL